MSKNTFDVGLFFYVQGRFLVHGCSLEEAEHYGDYLLYPEGHYEIWHKHYAKQYGVDFDHFPRGRFSYRKSDDTYRIICDGCLSEDDVQVLLGICFDEAAKVEVVLDEHYQCHQCNKGYVE